MRSSLRGWVASTSRRNWPRLASQGPRSCGELLVDFAAKTLGEGGAFSGSGDGDLQIAAGDDGAEEKIAVGDVVDAVAKDIALESAGVDGWLTAGESVAAMTMKLPSRSESAKGRSTSSRLSFKSQLANFGVSLGRDDAETQAGLEQAADFLEGHVARTDQQTRAAVEFEEDGLEGKYSAPVIAKIERR